MKKIKNMRIGKKLFLSFVVVVLLFAIADFAGLMSIHIISKDMNTFYNKQFQIVQISQSLKTDVQGFAKGLARVHISSQKIAGMTEENRVQFHQEKIDEMQSFLDAFGTDLETLNALDTSAVAKEDLDTINVKYPTLQSLIKQVLLLYENGRTEEAYNLTMGSINDAGYAAGSALNNIIEISQKEAKEKYEHTQLVVKEIFIFIIILSVFLLLIVIVLCLLLTNSISRPLVEMDKAAKKLSEGNLKQEISFESQDEIGSLASSLRETIRVLQKYVGEIDRFLNAIGEGKLNYHTPLVFRGDFRPIKDAFENISVKLTSAMIQINISADQVMQGAEQIAGSGQALSQATLEQASSVEELGSTINEVSSRINETAQNAMDTSKLTEELGTEVNASSEQMKNMSAVMKKMQDMSTDITGIIKDIEDIAFQTNILSLNAAVEAARAGEAGKGFSVVANEIRRLSSKTTEASKTTSELIHQTIQMMNEGVSLADKTSDKLAEVVSSSRIAADKVNLISHASSDQATAVVQLRQSIAMISDVVQENSATAEESAASSEELTGQMQMLKELVGAFEYEE